VVPLENEAVNECWIADRDRFSYEALNSDQRLTSPMLKQGGKWINVDWQTALEYVANGLKVIKSNQGGKCHWRVGQSAQHLGRAVFGWRADAWLGV
jgi:NADH-quinone oxidoreductase subunit G